MDLDKEVVIEFSKMLLEHSESLLKIAGGLAVVNLFLIANIHNVKGVASRQLRCASFLVALSAIACGVSFVFGYLANAAVIASMSDYATTGRWESSNVAEWCTLGQIIGLAGGIGVFLIVLFLYRGAALEALRRVKSGGGE